MVRPTPDRLSLIDSHRHLSRYVNTRPHKYRLIIYLSNDFRHEIVPFGGATTYFFDASIIVMRNIVFNNKDQGPVVVGNSEIKGRNTSVHKAENGQLAHWKKNLKVFFLFPKEKCLNVRQNLGTRNVLGKLEKL